MDDSRKGDTKARKTATGPVAEPTDAAEPLETAAPPETTVPDGMPSGTVRNQRLLDHVDEDRLKGALFHGDRDVTFEPLTIALRNVRANSRVLITIRDDQYAVWSEGDGRGLYCGAIGFIGFDGAMDLNVAIRTGMPGQTEATFQAGGGVTLLSEGTAEYRETLVKAGRISPSVHAAPRGST